VPAELQIAQFVASIALTVASLTVAVVSLLFAYRNNFGWKPLLLVTGHGVQNIGGDREVYEATVSLEFWNRRKYPLVLRYMKVELSALPLVYKPTKEGWHVHAGNSVMNTDTHILEPTSHMQFKAEAPFGKRSLDGLVDDLTITLIYYDPRLNTSVTITAKHHWSLGR